MKQIMTLITAIVVSATMAYGQDQETTEKGRPSREGGSDFRQRMQERMKNGRQGSERPGGEGRAKGDRQGGRGREDVMERLLSNPEMREKLGISEEDAEEIKGELHDIKIETIELKSKMEKIGLEQAKEMTSKEPNKKRVFKLAKEAGSIRTEIGILKLKRMFLFRENVDPEKMQAMRGQLHERMRAGRGGQDGEGGSEKRRPGGQGSEKRRRRPDGGDKDRGATDEE